MASSPTFSSLPMVPGSTTTIGRGLSPPRLRATAAAVRGASGGLGAIGWKPALSPSARASAACSQRTVASLVK
jgi:hypothetical protein